MPVVKAPSLALAHKSFSPYDSHHSRPAKGSLIRIHTPSFDGSFSGYDFPSYDEYDDLHSSMSQWMSAGPVYSDSDLYESTQCPPSFVSPPFDGSCSSPEPLDNALYAWPYEGHSGYDSSFSSAPEPTTFSHAMSPSVSVISCSPRSESLSLSPQPNFHEYSNALNFDFGTALQFPSSSWSPTLLENHSPRSSFSHSPTASCSSLDATDTKPVISRDPSPSRHEADRQDQRRRFPCGIVGCERRFTSQYTLKVHMEAHKPKPRTSFPCTLGCSERFSRQHDRLRHEVAKHGKICEFLCDDCGRFFSTKKTLGNHKCPVAQGGTRWVNN